MTAVATRRNLVAHPKLLLDVVNRQAGSLDKAILEGVMNAIEAGATEVRLDFAPADGDQPAKLSISDDGKGINSETEIEEFFETFGTPHDESEGKIWAQFRMGRGQIFSFGKNTWRTSTFKMEVDIETWGLEYELTKGLEEYNGCQIRVDLYANRIGYITTKGLQQSVKNQIEFMPIPIFFNGEQVNTPAKDLDWMIEDEDAYYLFGVGNELSVYNLGAFVKTIDAYYAGVTGTIVSKKQLKVNFARNDIQSDCEVYQRVLAIVKKNRIKQTRTRKTLSTEQRIATLIALRDDEELYKDVRNASLIPTSSRNNMSLHKVRVNTLPWTFAPVGDRYADKLMQSEAALCLDETILDKLGFDGEPEDFFTWLIAGAFESGYNGKYDQEKELKKWAKVAAMYRPFDELEDNVNRSATLVPEKSYSKVEKRLLRVLNKYPERWENRTLAIGLSDVYDAWTDGNSYIAIGRQFLKRVGVNTAHGAQCILTVLCHELAHDEATDGSHVHGPEFYERYHEITMKEWDNPLALIAQFNDLMRGQRIEDHTFAVQQKDEKALAARNSKLGITE